MSRDLERRMVEVERRLANLLRFGTVDQVDYAGAKVRVSSGDLLTGWLNWLTRRAGGDRDWWAPEIGEQVMVLSPFGDPALGVVLPAVYQSVHPAPAASAEISTVVYGDGTTITYDRAGHVLTVDCVGDIIATAGGDIEATAGGTVTIEAADIATLRSAVHVQIEAPSIGLSASSGGASVGNMTGSFSLQGDLQVTGNISASGTVVDGSGNTNHHSHP